jgi:hypothetical protein
MSPAAFRAQLSKAQATGQRAAVLKLAYDAAKAKAGGNPTRAQVREQVSKALSTLTNERAKGRVNDGYVDRREAGLAKTELASEVYALVDSGELGANSKPTAASDLGRRASIAKIERAVKNLGPVITAGFKRYDPDNDDDGEGLGRALRAAAAEAGLSSLGRAAILTALNGATTRADGASPPSSAAVKQLLANAVTKLKQSDGAAIVDFARPSKAPTSKRDGIVTGLELDRTPAATGMTSRVVLQYASTL